MWELGFAVAASGGLADGKPGKAKPALDMLHVDLFDVGLRHL